MKSTILLLFQTIVLSTWLTPVIFLTPRCDPKKESQCKWPTEFFFDPESDTKILARFKYLIQRFESDRKNFFWVHKIHRQNLIICLSLWKWHGLFQKDRKIFMVTWSLWEWLKLDLEYFRRSLWGHLKMTQPDGNQDDFYLTRKCPLCGHCLASPGRRQRTKL